jgi:membrane protease YdiL (CAAX protease family)
MLLLFFVAQAIVGVVIQALGYLPPEMDAVSMGGDKEGAWLGDFNQQIALGNYVAAVYPISMLFAVGLIWLYVRLRSGKQPLRIRHSISGFNPSVVLVGVVWLIAAQILLEPLMTILPHSEGRGIGSGAWACVTALVSAPVFEELLCRGVLFETLRKRWGVVISILVSSLFFGLMHFDWATAIVAIVAGVIFGILYVRTSSLFTTIIIHSINNAMAYTLIAFGVGDVSLYEHLGGSTIYWVVYGIAAAVFVACCIEAYFQVFRRMAKMGAK